MVCRQGRCRFVSDYWSPCISKWNHCTQLVHLHNNLHCHFVPATHTTTMSLSSSSSIYVLAGDTGRDETRHAMNFIYSRTQGRRTCGRLTLPSDFLYASKIRQTSSGPAEAVCLPISKCCVMGLLSMGFWGTMGPLLNLENIFAAGILHLGCSRARGNNGEECVRVNSTLGALSYSRGMLSGVFMCRWVMCVRRNVLRMRKALSTQLIRKEVETSRGRHDW